MSVALVARVYRSRLSRDKTAVFDEWLECGRCGVRVGPDDVFCRSCGARFSATIEGDGQ